MRNNQRPGSDTLSWPGYELPLPVSFAVANAAVYHVLSTLLISAEIVDPPPRDETAGAVRYMLHVSSGQVYAIHVLARGEHRTELRIQPVNPWDPYDPEVARDCVVVFAWMQAEVVRTIRADDPTFGMGAGELIPPMPSWQSSSLDALAWKAVYAPAMSDQTFADRQGIALSTLKNARTQQRVDRPKRGRPKKA